MGEFLKILTTRSGSQSREQYPPVCRESVHLHVLWVGCSLARTPMKPLRTVLFLIGLFLPGRVLTQESCCDSDTYHRALNIVFGQATNGERVATVQVLSAFQPEWAIAFDKTPNGLAVSRITFRKQLWGQLGLGGPGAPRTASQCIELAKAAPVDRASVPLPRESAQRFIDDLAEMDFAIDRCPRHKDGTCAYIMDGVDYVVQFRDGRSARLTDVSAYSGMRSENAALSNWVTEVLKESWPPAPK
jgi:hypothetical protein